MKSEINSLINKYWEGQTSLTEDETIREYILSDRIAEEHRDLVPLFSYYKSESDISMDFDINLSFTKEKQKPKVRFLMPKIIGIAASLLLLLTVGYQQFNVTDASYNNKYTEVQDPDEALEIAIEALGFLSNKYRKGTTPVSKGFKNIEKADVFNFKK